MYFEMSVSSPNHNFINRWGHVAVLLNSRPYIDGELSDLYNTYSYASAPATLDVPLFDLSIVRRFSTPLETPFYDLLSCIGVAYTFCIQCFSHPPLQRSTQSKFPNGSDHTRRLDYIAFSVETQSWADEPMRECAMPQQVYKSSQVNRLSRQKIT